MLQGFAAQELHGNEGLEPMPEYLTSILQILDYGVGTAALREDCWSSTRKKTAAIQEVPFATVRPVFLLRSDWRSAGC